MLMRIVYIALFPVAPWLVRPLVLGAEVGNSNIQSKPTSDGFIELQQVDGSSRLIPVITGDTFTTIVLTAMYGAVLLLVITMLLAFFFAKRGENIASRNQFLSEALPNAIEGITIIYIVVAVLLFGILGITSAEGNLSILSAISGYVLGKSQGKRTTPQVEEEQLSIEQIVRKMVIAGVEQATISEVTGLSLEQVQKLSK